MRLGREINMVHESDVRPLFAITAVYKFIIMYQLIMEFTMENLLSSNIMVQVIQAVSAILVAIITFVVGPVVVAKVKKRQRHEDKTPSTKPSRLRYAIVSGIAAAITFVAIGGLFAALTPKPKVVITNPSPAQNIDVRLAQTGSGSFRVSGTSSKVSLELKIYVLLHPVDPFASGWWVQQPAGIGPDGKWNTEAWYGSKDNPPQVGNKIDILAVVTSSEQVLEGTHQIDLKKVNPVAQSEVVSLIIGSTR